VAKHTLILAGTARPHGDTVLAARRLCAELGGEASLVDLAALDLQPFAYGGRADRDGFAALVSQMLEHRQIVFATPVYWYAMSGVLKVFFDRLTDLLQPPHKELGRALAGRGAWLLATGTDPEPPPGFTEPFARTAGYFGLRWGGECYVRSIGGAPPDEDELAKLTILAAKLRGP
jgi:hypothetical protein